MDGSEGGGVEEISSNSSSNESMVIGSIHKQRKGRIEYCEAGRVTYIGLLGQARTGARLRTEQRPRSGGPESVKKKRYRDAVYRVWSPLPLFPIQSNWPTLFSTAVHCALLTGCLVAYKDVWRTRLATKSSRLNCASQPTRDSFNI